MYISSEDLQRVKDKTFDGFQSYILVQVPKSAETEEMDDGTFSDAKKEAIEKYKDEAKDLKDALNERAGSVEEKLKKVTGYDAEVHFNGVSVVQDITEDADWLYYVTLANNTVTADGKTWDTSALTSNLMVRASGRALWVYVNEVCDDDQPLDHVNAVTTFMANWLAENNSGKRHTRLAASARAASGQGASGQETTGQEASATDQETPSQENSVVKIGEVEIYLPEVEGYLLVPQSAKALYDYFGMFVADTNRLLALYLSFEDVDRLRQGKSLGFDSYIMLQAARDLENASISDAFFLKARKNIREQAASVQKSIQPLVEDSVASTSGKMQKKFGTDFDANVEGVFLAKDATEGKRWIYYVTLTNTAINMEGQEMKTSVLTSSAVARVSERVILAYVAKMNTGRDPLKHVEKMTEYMCDWLVKLNPSYP